MTGIRDCDLIRSVQVLSGPVPKWDRPDASSRCLAAEDMADLLLCYTAFESYEHGPLAAISNVRDCDLEFIVLERDPMTRQNAARALRARMVDLFAEIDGTVGLRDALEELLEDSGTPICGPHIRAAWVADGTSLPVSNPDHVDFIESAPEQSLLCIERQDGWSGPRPSSLDEALEALLEVYADPRGFTVQRYQLQAVLLS